MGRSITDVSYGLIIALLRVDYSTVNVRVSFQKILATAVMYNEETYDYYSTVRVSLLREYSAVVY